MSWLVEVVISYIYMSIYTIISLISHQYKCNVSRRRRSGMQNCRDLIIIQFFWKCFYCAKLTFLKLKRSQMPTKVLPFRGRNFLYVYVLELLYVYTWAYRKVSRFASPMLRSEYIAYQNAIFCLIYSYLHRKHVKGQQLLVQVPYYYCKERHTAYRRKLIY